MLAKIINRLFHEKSTKQPYRSQGNTNKIATIHLLLN